MSIEMRKSFIGQILVGLIEKTPDSKVMKAITKMVEDWVKTKVFMIKWASSWDYGTYHIGDQRRLRLACTSTQSRQSLRCSHIWSMEVDEWSNKKSDI